MHFKNRDFFISDFTNNSECFNLDSSVAKSIIEPRFLAIVEKLEKDMDFFLDDSKKFGFNRLNQKCMIGFSIEYYNRGGIIYEPVILNLETKGVECDFKKMGMNKDDSENYFNHTKAEYNFKRLINVCYIFGDKNKVQEFLFDKNHLFSDNHSPSFYKALNDLWDNSQKLGENKKVKPKM